ncbi:MAG: ribosome-associated translation inhibitor RaiA [Clostridiales bacterium]|nr:ribosome-associated translation inhibitor RaiA [Clostridiales bacterium]
MRFTISGKNIDLTPGLQSAVESKLNKLDRYFHPDTEIIVTLSVEKDRQKIEVTVPMKGTVVRAEEVSDSMYTSIDLVQETIERQLIKYKNRLVDRSQSSFTPEYVDEVEADEDDAIQIVRTKRFAIKPMDPEEACLQMEMLGHNFFVFRNAETDLVSVVYKRKGNNTYGLIEPEC